MAERKVELFPLLCGLIFISIGTLTLLGTNGISIDTGWTAASVLLAVGFLGLAMSIRRSESHVGEVEPEDQNS